MSPEQNSLKSLPPVGTLLTEAWANYKNKFLLIFQIALVPAVLQFASSFVFGNGLSGEQVLPTIIGGNLKLILPAILLLLVGVVVYWLSILSMLFVLSDQQVSGSVITYYKKASQKFFSYFWIVILGVFVVSGSFFFLIIPALVVSVWILFAVYILINENTGGLAALVKSRSYVRGHWWGVFGRYILLGIVSIFCLFVLSFFASFILGMIGSVLPLTNFVMALISFFIQGFLLAGTFTIYRQLKELKSNVVDLVSDESTKKWFIGLSIFGLVCMILALLAAPILMVSLNTARQKAVEASYGVELSRARLGLELYYDENGTYPAQLGSLVPKYLPSLPADARKVPIPYEYQLTSGGTDFSLCTTFKGVKDCATASKGFVR